MWKTGIAAAAVGIATLVGVIVFGRQLVEPDPAPDPLPSAGAPLQPWGPRAGGRCDDALASVRTELARPPGLTTPNVRAVELFRATTEIEGRLVALLRALAVGVDELPQVDEVLDLLEQQYERDVETAAQLARAYDPGLLRRELAAYERRATTMRTLFGALDADGCVSYLDPASYG